MEPIDRSFLVVKGNEPFFRWARSLPNALPDIDPAQINRDLPGFLVPVLDDDGELADYLETAARGLFESIMSDWETNRKLWPAPRNATLFRQWFHVELVAMVVDVEE